MTRWPLAQPSLLLHYTLPLSPALHPFVFFAVPASHRGSRSCACCVDDAFFYPPSQLKQWKAFEEENQTVSHMAKYFTSPSRSCRSMYSEEQLYQLIGEKNSMKRLLTEVQGSAGPPRTHQFLPFSFVGLKALQGGKPFLMPQRMLVVSLRPLPPLLCFVTSLCTSKC